MIDQENFIFNKIITNLCYIFEPCKKNHYQCYERAIVIIKIHYHIWRREITINEIFS